MNHDDIQKFQGICLRVKKSFVEDSWNFDSRFNSLIIVFDKKSMELAFKSLNEGFTRRWDSISIKKASKPVRKLVKTLYGIEPGQFIFAEENPAQDIALYAAWWPWGNGESISLRISIFSTEKRTISCDTIREYLVEWFGL